MVHIRAEETLLDFTINVDESLLLLREDVVYSTAVSETSLPYMFVHAFSRIVVVSKEESLRAESGEPWAKGIRERGWR